VNMVIPNEGKALLATMCFAYPVPVTEDFVVDLYQNNYTPTDSSTASSFTVAAFTGYAQVAVARSTFGTPGIVANVAQITSSVSPLFTCTGGGGQTVYGWYMRGATSNKVYAAAAFDTPRVLNPIASELLQPFTINLKTFA